MGTCVPSAGTCCLAACSGVYSLYLHVVLSLMFLVSLAGSLVPDHASALLTLLDAAFFLQLTVEGLFD